MDEHSEDELTYPYDININFTEQRQILDRLNSKYNVKPTKPSASSTITSSSQQDTGSSANSISRTNSCSSNASTSSNNKKTVQVAKTKRNDKKPTKTIIKNKFENVCVALDCGFLKTYGETISNELEVLEIKYEFRTQINSNLITWNYLEEDSVPKQSTEFETVLLVLNWKDVVRYVSKNSLIQQIKSISDKLKHKRITLGLYGFENYFKYWKSRKQGKTNDQRFADYKNCTKISRSELEYVLTELELRYFCCHRFLEDTKDIVDIISQYTKSIAQLPEKLEKNDKYKNFDFCLLKDTRDCVLVDKNGNGFRRLWQQQLTTFEMVRLETAEAILSKYSTPAHLFQAYATCDASEGTKLLEDIPIRRAVGPLAAVRRLGPELSNKAYNFFNAIDGSTLI